MIEKTLAATTVNKNNHYMRVFTNPLGIHLEIGFTGSWKDAKSSYEIDVSRLDLHQFQKMIGEFITTIESKETY